MAITDFTDDGRRDADVARAAARLLPLAGASTDLRRLCEVFEDAGKRLLSRIETDDPAVNANLAEALDRLGDARDFTQLAWEAAERVKG